MKITNARINKLLAGFLLFTAMQEGQKTPLELLPEYLDVISHGISSKEKECFSRAVVAWFEDGEENPQWTNLNTELGAFAVLFRSIVLT